MKFTQLINKDERVQDYNRKYMEHPFIKEIQAGTLPREKFKKYLIQDSLYLKDYAKVYANVFLLTEDTEDLQFLHECIGVIVADETNMHKQYLNQFGLTFKEIDKMKVEKENADYLAYMLGFAPTKDVSKIFVSALPCTLTYEYIGKTLMNDSNTKLEDNPYAPWMETYGSKDFERFSVKSCELVNRMCEGLDQDALDELLEIYITACEHELQFWNMSYKSN